MAIGIRSNLASLTAQRRLHENTSIYSQALERLASGQRINRASDDAAGLAISSSLRAKQRIYSQGIRNINDGISALNIADSTIGSLTDITTRIRELATQAASGSLSSSQRQALDTEAQELNREFTRLIRSARFNRRSLLDGTFGTLRIQAGFGSSEAVNSSLGGLTGNGTFGSGVTSTQSGSNRNKAQLVDVNGDGNLDSVVAGGASEGRVHVSLGNGDGTFAPDVSYQVGGLADLSMLESIEVKDINNDGNLDIVSGGWSSTSSAFMGILMGNGDGTFTLRQTLSYATLGEIADIKIADLNNDGKLDLAWTSENTADGIAMVQFGNGNGSFSSVVTYSMETDSTIAIELVDLDNDGDLDLITAGMADDTFGYATIRLNNGSGSFGAAVSYRQHLGSINDLEVGDFSGDGMPDLATIGTGGVYTRLNAGVNGLFYSLINAYSGSAGVTLDLHDLNNDGLLDLIFGSGGTGRSSLANPRDKLSSVSPFTSFDSFSIGNAIGAVGDINNDGVLDVLSSDLFEVVSNLGSGSEGTSPLTSFSLATMADARQAIGMLDKTLERLSRQRAVLGASQSRLSVAMQTLADRTQNCAAANSRISDADIAENSATLTRSSILREVSTAVLAQANVQPSIALRLLNFGG